MTLAALVGTRVCAQCLESLGPPCLIGLAWASPPTCPHGLDILEETKWSGAVSRVTLSLDLLVTSCTAEEMVPAEHTLFLLQEEWVPQACRAPQTPQVSKEREVPLVNPEPLEVLGQQASNGRGAGLMFSCAHPTTLKVRAGIPGREPALGSGNCLQGEGGMSSRDCVLREGWLLG